MHVLDRNDVICSLFIPSSAECCIPSFMLRPVLSFYIKAMARVRQKPQNEGNIRAEVCYRSCFTIVLYQMTKRWETNPALLGFP